MNDLQRDFTKPFDAAALLGNSSSPEGAERWAVPWADLMMVMFVLFVVMFIYAQTHQDVKVLFSEETAQKIEKTSSLDPLIGLIGQISGLTADGGGSDSVRMPVNEILYKSKGNGITVIRDNNDRVRITLSGNLFFGTGQSGLAKTADQYLQEIADVVRVSTGSVHVIGHADEEEVEGTDSFALSTKRAADVAAYFIDTFNMSPDRFVISGRGAYRPDVPSTNGSSRSKNRRVEVILLTDRI